MIADYTGAGTRLSLDAALKLPRGWAYQPKIDGTYCRVTTDERGRIESALSRDAYPVDLGDLLGIVAGPPLAVLHGEFEAGSEAAMRISAGRGWRNLHLFDCTRVAGASIERQPYAERYAAIHRAHVDIEMAGLGRLAPMQPDPRTFTWTMPGDGKVRAEVQAHQFDPSRKPWPRYVVEAAHLTWFLVDGVERRWNIGVNPGDYIVTRPSGSVTVMRPEKFNARYETFGDATSGPVTATARAKVKRRNWSPAGAMIPGGPPRDLRRVPVVPTVRTRAQAEQLWDEHVLRGGGEGIVAVALAAPAGRRNAKRKVKQLDTLEAVCLRIGGGTAELRRGDQVFYVSARGSCRPQPGDVVEVVHFGFSEHDFSPRFARMVRIRSDIKPSTSE